MQSRSQELTASQLLEACENIYATFNFAGGVPPGTHLEEKLVALGANEDEKCFITEVVYGMMRFRKFLSSFLESFYHHNSGVALRGDAVKYRVLTYLAAFRLQELSWLLFRLLLESQDAQKVLVLLGYLFDADKLQNVCREGWLQLYDKQFVDDTISGLLSWQPEAGALVQQLKDQVYFTQRQQDSKDASTSGRGSSPTRRLKPTRPREFKLSQPRPKPLPQPELIPPAPRPKPAPKPRQGPTKEELAIEAAKAKNRAVLQEKHARCGPFKLRVLERPMHVDTLRAEADAELAAELAMRPRAKPAPPPPTAEVRLTAAAVLREDALYKKKQAEEAAALQRYEAELRDCADFDRWQQAMRDADAAEQAERVEKLRQEMSTAAGSAAQAKADLLAAKAATSNAEKAARAEREEQRQRLLQEQQQANAQRAEEVAAERVKAKQAQEAALSERRLSAQEVRLHAQELAQQRAEQAAREAAERRDIIAQLRGLEKAAKAQQKQQGKLFDATAVSEYGMNNQMSLAELRARLTAAKQRQLEEEERARAQILAQRQAREAALTTTVSQLAAIRRLASAQATLRKAAAQVQRAQTAAAVLQRTEDQTLELADRLNARHAATAAEAARIAAEEKRIKFEQMQNAAGAAVVEANKFRELREGAKRRCELRQNGKLQQAHVDEANEGRLSASRKQLLALHQQQHSSLQKQYDRNLLLATQQAQTDAVMLLTSKQHKIAQRRGQEEQQRQQHAMQAYMPFGGSHTSMQARLQALAAGAELP